MKIQSLQGILQALPLFFSILEKINIKVKACFLVAGFIGRLNIEGFIEVNKTFVEKQFNWNKIKENCNKFYIINSKDNPYVPLKRGQKLSNYLDT